MEKKRLLELAGIELNEAGPGGKKYPVIVAEYDVKQAFKELQDEFGYMVDDEQIPKDTKFTIDMVTDEVMQKFVEAIAYVYDQGGSDDRRADNYGDAMNKIMKAILKVK